MVRFRLRFVIAGRIRILERGRFDGKSVLFTYGAQVDSIKDQTQCRRLDLNAGRGKILEVWKTEGAFGQELIPHGESIPVPKEYFDPICSFILKDEEKSGMRIEIHRSPDDPTQRLEAHSHICVFCANENPGAR